MVRKEKIDQRLPHFYLCWDPATTLSRLTAAVGKGMDEAEKDLISIARSHWIDTSFGGDLERQGAIYEIKRRPQEDDSDYRNRLKTSIISYRGGGTLGAIKAVMRVALRLPSDWPVEIVENPMVSLTRTWKLKAGEEWHISPSSIYETVPEITITLETDSGRISEPTVANLANEEYLTYKGELTYGDELKIVDGKAFFNGEDRSHLLTTRKIPVLPRHRSRWRYEEFLGANQGIFDQGKFDRSVFVMDVTTSVTFRWTAHLPAEFVVNIPKDLLDKAGVSREYLQEVLDSTKASGVKGTVKVL